MNRCCYVSHSPVSCSATDGKRERERERALSMRHITHAAWRLCMTPKTTLLKTGSVPFHRPEDCTDLLLNHFNPCWRSAQTGNFSGLSAGVLRLSGVTGATGSLASSSVSRQPEAKKLCHLFACLAGFHHPGLLFSWHSLTAITPQAH